MNNKKAKWLRKQMAEKAKKKFHNMSDFACPDCNIQLCNCIIERIRQMENAMIQSKDALELMERANTKLTADLNMLREKNEKITHEAERRFFKRINDAKAKIDAQAQRVANRGKLIG